MIPKTGFQLASGLLTILALGSLAFGQPAAPSAPAPAVPSESPLRYDIRVELDHAARLLHGEEEIVWVNTTRDEVSDMWFHLYWNAFKNEKSAFMEEARADGGLGGGVSVEDGAWGWVDITRIALADGTDLRPTLEFMTPDSPPHPGDQTVARVRFPAAVKPGEAVRLTIGFESKIPKAIRRTGYYHDGYFISQWFPKPGVYEEGKGWNCHEYHLNSEFFADFASFRVQLKLPSSFVVGASGHQVSAVSAPDGKTVTTTFEEDRIHDFAWTADPRFIKIERDFIGGREVSEKEYGEAAAILGLPVDEVRLPDVKMILLIEPEHKAQTERHFRALREAVKYYGLWYGPYPYRTVTMVDPPFRTASGGMEYPTLFTAGTGVLTDPKVHNPEGVIIHEFGHGYWYGLSANNEFEEAWLDEGMNTYSTGKVEDAAYGRGMLSASISGWPLTRIFNFPRYDGYELDRVGAILSAERDPITTASWQFSNGMSYGMNVYQRAACTLDTLERLIGPEVMLRLLRTFHMRYRFHHPHTRDFIDTAIEVSGKDLGWFFQEFFFSTHNFDYGVSELRSREKRDVFRGVFEADGAKKEITEADVRKDEKKERKDKAAAKTYLTEVVVRRFGEARLGGDAQVTLRVTFEDGSVQTAAWDGQDRWRRFVFETPSRAKSAEVDPQLVWLLDSDLSNNSLTLRPSRGGPVRLASRFLFWFENALVLVGGLI
jgi:Peptidase family M1 domain